MDQRTTEHEVIRLLQLVLSGAEVTEQAVMNLAGEDFSPRAGQAWHQLTHWVTDEDIRARDPEYAAIQLDMLRRELAALNGG